MNTAAEPAEPSRTSHANSDSRSTVERPHEPCSPRVSWVPVGHGVATQGPWRASWEGRDHWSGDSFIGTGRADARGVDIYVSTDEGPAGQADLDFIAAARQDVPALVAEVRRLRKQLGADAGGCESEK
jgi:hypothetical protein